MGYWAPVTRKSLLANGVRALAVVSGASLLTTGRPAVAADPSVLRTVRVASNASDDATSVLYALQAGIFWRNGLDVQLQHLNSTTGLAAAVASGAYDIAKTSLSSVLAAHERGLGFKIAAPGSIYDNAHASQIGGYIVAVTSSSTGRDFSGKTVAAIDLNGMSDLALKAWVDENGGDSSSLHFMELTMSAALAAVEQGRVFAAACANPYLAAALTSGKVRLVPAYGAIAPRFLFSAWITSADWASKNLDKLQRFQRSVAQAAIYTNAHPEETAQLLSDASSIPLATIESMPRVENGIRVIASEVQTVIDSAAKYKMIQRSFPASDIIA